ncbi:unnamed protein product, partial [Staurois parvus]
SPGLGWRFLAFTWRSPGKAEKGETYMLFCVSLRNREIQNSMPP